MSKLLKEIGKEVLHTVVKVFTRKLQKEVDKYLF